MSLSTSSFFKWAAAAALGASALVAANTAQAQVSWSVGVHAPGVSVGVANPAPVYYAPAPVYYAPPPVYYRPPPPVYRPAPVYYGPPPVYYGPPRYYGPRHHHHRHHGRGHWR
ncbi:hypothetical protein PGB34_00570 [Xenophilus arseniciresistens]|uniref:PXPV repeat-containing protein n=1 Tax=Xenophilus arseniciresistens TaxID=1283306 RepID=A0AAE3N4P8_9BURK|nr:hypothetical protein [Xenophilus arseniciresistens]MDA7414843.1 hypothetical protein [Xenophilus arseniciresistens]